MQDPMPVGLSDVGAVLRRRWWLLVFIPLLSMLVAWGLSSRSADQTSYKASTTVLLVKGDGFGNTSDKWMPTYRELVRSQTVLETARQKVQGLDIGQLRSMISVQIVPDTQLLQVWATAESPVLAEQVAGEVAQALLAEAKRLMTMQSTAVVDTTPASLVATSGLKRSVVSALLVGCIAAAALVVFLESLSLLGRGGKRG